MLLADHQIKELCLSDQKMIYPFKDSLIRQVDGKRIVSAGLSSYGYDITLDNKFKVYKSKNNHRSEYNGVPCVIGFPSSPVNIEQVIDPLNIQESQVDYFEADSVILGPGQFILAASVEYFNIPNNVTFLVSDKSTYMRCGISVFNTVGESGWSGILTLEISNNNSVPVLLRANEGIAQILFIRGDASCQTSYADRNGKYQNQTGVTLPR